MNDNFTDSFKQLPSNILEAFIPGYAVVSHSLLTALGFDVNIVVSICILIFGLYKSILFVGTLAYEQVQYHFMSFIAISLDDDICDHVFEWLQGHQVSKRSRALLATTSQQHAWDVLGNDAEAPGMTGKAPHMFQLYSRSRWFSYNGTWFQFSRSNRESNQGSGRTGSVQEEKIKLTCIGRSTEPIKELLKECHTNYLVKRSACTVVKRPAPKESRSRFLHGSYWTTAVTRPKRPMETVLLDDKQKVRVLAEIKEYLDPLTSIWYANRGVPYRRGYLFHGLPGTGKTSFAWAIAGVFGLNIHCLSLAESGVSDEDLSLMFSHLPRRCIVLLEDVDSAGLDRRQEQAAPDEKFKNKNEKISLSGLLNAIDGVASHEGRVLIMTTNFPEKLDDAMIRAGRIDMKVEFTLASRDQIQGIFSRMYSPDPPAQARSEATKIHNYALDEMASQFAAKLPQYTFSPAEVQGFLLNRKKEPEKALQDVDEWRDRLLEEKATKGTSPLVNLGKDLGGGKAFQRAGSEFGLMDEVCIGSEFQDGSTHEGSMGKLLCV